MQTDLQEQVNNFKGIALMVVDLPARRTFSYGMACYPGKHAESPNMDRKFYKNEVDNGAEYLVTQMFFDNQNISTCRSLSR